MHVITFDSFYEESPPLKTPSDVYKFTFFNPGIFTYRCSIYHRMNGCIEVIDNIEAIPRPFVECQEEIIPETVEDTYNF